jgi:hypothetical protein
VEKKARSPMGDMPEHCSSLLENLWKHLAILRIEKTPESPEPQTRGGNQHQHDHRAKGGVSSPWPPSRREVDMYDFAAIPHGSRTKRRLRKRRHVPSIASQEIGTGIMSITIMFAQECSTTRGQRAFVSTGSGASQ